MSERKEGKVRWGIIGPGNIARHAVAPAIRYSQNGYLQAVASRQAKRALAIALESNAEKSYGTYEALLADGEVEAVYIGLPNGLHEEWVLRASAAGKHVLCEKSMAYTRESALRMRSTCEKSGVLLMEAFMYRHHPQWPRIRDLVYNGAIGQIRTVTASLCGNLRNESDHRWQYDLGRGALYDVTCYGINVARYITGEEPIDVSAYAALTEGGEPVDHTSHVTMLFPGGAIASVQGSLRSHPAQSLHIIGSHGRIDVDKPFIPGHEPTKIHLHQESHIETFEISGANHFLHQIEHLGLCIQGKLELCYPAEDGVANATICEAAEKSWREKRPVEIEKS